jgi:hypothetical protein
LDSSFIAFSTARSIPRSSKPQATTAPARETGHMKDKERGGRILHAPTAQRSWADPETKGK